MNYLKEFTILAICLLIGSIIRSFINFPIPEAVYGMVILFILLLSGILKVKDVDDASRGLLKNLAFFFVPAGVGMMNQFDILKKDGLSIIIVTFVSTIITMVVTAKTVEFIQRRRKL